ncbi:MAG: hypothetical protein ABWZ67_14390 [Solirubrobacteraceae bacterium]
MTDKTRIKIAAAVTALFLAGISAAGLAARDGQPQAAATTEAQPTATLDQSAPAGERAGYEADQPPYEEHEDDE